MDKIEHENRLDLIEGEPDKNEDQVLNALKPMIACVLGENDFEAISDPIKKIIADDIWYCATKIGLVDMDYLDVKRFLLGDSSVCHKADFIGVATGNSVAQTIIDAIPENLLKENCRMIVVIRNSEDQGDWEEGIQIMDTIRASFPKCVDFLFNSFNYFNGETIPTRISYVVIKNNFIFEN